MIQLKKFTIGQDWVPIKLDVSVDMTDELDLTSLRGHGLQSGELELPEAAPPAAPEITIDQTIVSNLVDMGFVVEGCRKAVYHTKNSGLEAATHWIMEHMGDPDFAEPLVLASAAIAEPQTAFVPNADSIAQVEGMGFSTEQAIRALKATNNRLDRAVDWIFSHMGELDQPMESESSGGSGSAGAGDTQRGIFRDGTGKYRMIGFISHMGTSTMVGHYVCHLLKEGKWVIYNDEKVAQSEKPPKDLGYLYLYERISQ